MFELCDRLFGIYKVKNCTSATYISPQLLEFDEKKKITNTRQVNSSKSDINTQHIEETNQQQQSTISQSQLTSNNEIEMIEE